METNGSWNLLDQILKKVLREDTLEMDPCQHCIAFTGKVGAPWPLHPHTCVSRKDSYPCGQCACCLLFHLGSISMWVASGNQEMVFLVPFVGMCKRPPENGDAWRRVPLVLPK